MEGIPNEVRSQILIDSQNWHVCNHVGDEFAAKKTYDMNIHRATNEAFLGHRECLEYLFKNVPEDVWIRDDVVGMAELGCHDDLVVWLHNHPNVQKPTSLAVYNQLLDTGNPFNIKRYLSWRVDSNNDWSLYLRSAATLGRFDICLFIAREGGLSLAKISILPTVYLSKDLDINEWYSTLPYECQQSKAFWTSVCERAIENDNVEILKWMCDAQISFVGKDRFFEKALKSQAKRVMSTFYTNEVLSKQCMGWCYSSNLTFFQEYVWHRIDFTKVSRVSIPLIRLIFRIMRQGHPEMVVFLISKNTKKWRYDLGKCLASANVKNVRMLVFQPQLEHDEEPYDFVQACIEATKRSTFLKFWPWMELDVPDCLLSQTYLYCLKVAKNYEHFDFFRKRLDQLDDVIQSERVVIGYYGFLSCLEAEDLTVMRVYSLCAPPWNSNLREEIVLVLERSLKNNRTFAVAEILSRWPQAFRQDMWNLCFGHQGVSETMIHIVHSCVGQTYPLMCTYVLNSLAFKSLCPSAYDLVVDKAADVMDMNVALMLARAAAVNHGNNLIYEYILSKF